MTNFKPIKVKQRKINTNCLLQILLKVLMSALFDLKFKHKIVFITKC